MPFQPHSKLSEICNELWNADENCLWPDTDYDIDLQGAVYSTSMNSDKARNKLFNWVNEENVFEKPTYKAFRALLDNYESETGVQETVTDKEEKEAQHFIDLICDTHVMQLAHDFLVKENKAEKELMSFKRQLYSLWFKLYRRTKGDRDFDSSSFEHVFVGETRGKDVIGFHNWIQFYLQEKHGNVDYKGFFKRGTDNESGDWCRIIKLQFSWKGDGGKPLGSSFIGVSPEFEFALYTVCFLVDEGKVDVKLGQYEVRIVTHQFGRSAIGTAYPELIE